MFLDTAMMEKFELPRCSISDQKKPFASGISKVAEASMALPQELLQRLPKILENYLLVQEAKYKDSKKDNAAIVVDGKKFEILSPLGSGDEADVFIVEHEGETYLAKRFRNIQNLELHVVETQNAREKSLPLIKICGFDKEQGILILEGKIGIPVSFLLQTEISGLSESEASSVLNLYLAFKEQHNLLGFSPGNLAFEPFYRGVFVIDLF